MTWSLDVSAAPASEPVTLQQAIDHLRLDDTAAADGGYIESLIQAAREMAETILNRSLFTQTLVLTLDQFPAGGKPIYLPQGPLQSITSIQYVDSNGTTQTWAASKYRADSASNPPRITPAYNEVYPTVRDVTGAVTITYAAGWDDVDDIPSAIKQALYLIIGHLYENRQQVVTGGAQPVEIPWGAKALLSPWKVETFHGPLG